ncbi:MAG: undecaprenyl-phosphate glucose phosphotransferase [Candidatus Berkelbacteria bacterium]|nr:undecaprenyl-phosphate glucose phosphotransferase [Candidatus Berkelbacteria bacterium]
MKRSELFFSFLLIPVDAAMIIASFVLAFYIRIKTDILPVNSDVTFKHYLLYVLYILPIWLIIFALSGLYKIARERNYFNDFYKIFVSNAVAILIFIVAIFFSRSYFFSRAILIIIPLLSVFLVFTARIIVTSVQRYLYRYGWGVHKVIIIGNNKVSHQLAREIVYVKRLGMKFIGIVNGLGDHEEYPNDLKLLGNIADLPEIIKKHHPDEIILTDVGINRDKILEIIQACSDANVSFKFISDVYSIVTTSNTSSVLAGFPVMELKTIALDGWGRIAKRFFDVLFSVVCLIVAAPFMLLVTIGTKITSPGPVIYKQKRVGRDGKSFDFYKFRSMYIEKCDTTQRGSKWTTADDDKNRITSFGKFIRKTNLDELPQFWNVFIGNMSFVGPRPELPKFVDEFQKEIPDYFRRHRVKSGLTGWAAVNGLKGDTSIPERVRFDIYYIENWSFWFDIKIIIKTIFLIIGEAFGGKYEYRDRS